VDPSNHPGAAPSARVGAVTTTAPTHGFGAVDPRTAAPSSIARRIMASSDPAFPGEACARSVMGP